MQTLQYPSWDSWHFSPTTLLHWTNSLILLRQTCHLVLSSHSFPPHGPKHFNDRSLQIIGVFESNNRSSETTFPSSVVLAVSLSLLIADTLFLINESETLSCVDKVSGRSCPSSELEEGLIWVSSIVEWFCKTTSLSSSSSESYRSSGMAALSSSTWGDDAVVSMT